MANCYLTKPVDLEQFLKVVRSVEDFWLGMVRLPRAELGIDEALGASGQARHYVHTH